MGNERRVVVEGGGSDLYTMREYKNTTQNVHDSKPALHLVAYDIEDDRERMRTGKLLEGFGQRVQKSVFECPLDRRRLREMEDALRGLGLKTGFILVYRLNKHARRRLYGHAPALSDSDEHAFVI